MNSLAQGHFRDLGHCLHVFFPNPKRLALAIFVKQKDV
jgi:hypothetical protein